MNIIRLAWSNLAYNKTRTIFNIVLIVVAFCSLVFISGYNNFSEEGIMLGITEGSGSIVIADKSYWDINSEKINYLYNDDIELLKNKLSAIEDVIHYQKKLDLSGVVGQSIRVGFFQAMLMKIFLG